jgi:cytochrome P450
LIYVAGKEAYLPSIFARLHAKRKTPVNMNPDPKTWNLFCTLDIKDHAVRRRAWESAFTTRSLVEIQPSVDALLDDLVKHIDKAAKTGTIIDMRKWPMLYSFDG